MKLLFIAPGGSVHTVRWVNFFAEQRYDVTLISDHFSSSLHEKIRKIPLIQFFSTDNRHSLLKKIFNQIFFGINCIKIKFIISQLKPQIVHSHFIQYNAYYGYFSRFNPLIISAWGSDVLITPKKSYYHYFFTKKSLKFADVVLCDANFFKKEIIEYGVESDKINVIYYGTNVDKFKPNIDANEIKTSLDLSNNFTIVSTRNLSQIYDIETLINAISIIIDKNPNIRVLIIGKGDQENYLKNLTVTMNLSHVITFLGAVQNDEMPKILAASDIYVSTSKSDAGLAASTAEAMACGLAPIITDFGDNNKWVHNGENGYLFPIGDFNCLADHIVNLLKNPTLRQKFGEKSREIIVDKNNYQKEMKKVESLYIRISKE